MSQVASGEVFSGGSIFSIVKRFNQAVAGRLTHQIKKQVEKRQPRGLPLSRN